MNESLLQNNPYWLVTTAASHMRHGFAQVAEGHNLSPSQMQALLLLQPGIPIPMNQLSCKISCDASYITGIVDRLSSLDYIRRQESALDRRIKTIELTRKGAAFRDALIKDFHTFASEDSPFHSLDQPTIEALQRLITIINEQAPRAKEV